MIHHLKMRQMPNNGNDIKNENCVCEVTIRFYLRNACYRLVSLSCFET
jgi:hypothetical protein